MTDPVMKMNKSCLSSRLWRRQTCDSILDASFVSTCSEMLLTKRATLNQIFAFLATFS